MKTATLYWSLACIVSAAAAGAIASHVTDRSPPPAGGGNVELTFCLGDNNCTVPHDGPRFQTQEQCQAALAGIEWALATQKRFVNGDYELGQTYCDN